MIDQGELTRLVRCLEEDALQTEPRGQAIGLAMIELPRGREQPHVLGALPRLYDDAHGTGLEPACSGGEQLVGLLVGETPAMLLTQLEVHLQPALARLAHDLRGADAGLGE